MTKHELKEHEKNVKASLHKLSINDLEVLIGRHEYANDCTLGKILDNFPDVKLSYEIYRQELTERLLLKDYY